ncbi:hypothetical protein GCM10023238_00090 [Streptomyces heliomycini]
MAVADHHRVEEVVVQMVDVLDDPVLGGAGQGHVVEHRQVLDEFAQADPAGVRAHRDAVLGGEQQDGEVLGDAADPGGVDLDDVEGAGLEELLEDDPVLRVLAGGHLHRGDGAADGRVAEDVVGAGGLLDPVRVELREGLGPADRLVHVPALVGVDRDAHIRSDGRAGGPAAPQVVVEVGADLELDLAETVGDRPHGEPGEFPVVVAEPAGRGGVGGVAALQQQGGAFLGALPAAAQEGEGLLGGEGVGEVAEVDLADQPRGVGLGEQAPQRFVRAFGGQVPEGVDDGPDRHVHHALLGSEPAQLAVAGQVAVQDGGVGAEFVGGPSDEMTAERFDRGDLDVVAPPDGEREPVPLVPVGVVGAQHDVGRRVVGVGVHRVGTVEFARGGEPDVVGVDGGDAGGSRGHGGPFGGRRGR